MAHQTPSGSSIEVSDTGPVSDPAGKATVVFLHAFPLDSGMWRPQIDAFGGRWRLLAPDFRGFGSSSGFSSRPSIEQLADDVNHLLTGQGITEPVVLCGLSMGGYVAFAFARKYPDRLRGLVLANTRSEPDDALAQHNRDKLIAYTEHHTAADVIELMIPRIVGESTRAGKPEVTDEVRRIGGRQTIDGIIGGTKALRDRPDSTPGLGDIKVPTLIITGTEDQITGPSVTAKLAEAIPGAKLVTIDGVGHLSNLENPAAFNAAVAEFVAGLAA